MKICPMPIKWDEIHLRLMDYAGTHTCDPSSPPKPLILAGWNFSNDLEKKIRWKETQHWAEKNGCAYLVDGIEEKDFYES